MITRLLNWIAHLCGYLPDWLDLPASWFYWFARRKVEQSAAENKEAVEELQKPHGNVHVMPPPNPNMTNKQGDKITFTDMH